MTWVFLCLGAGVGAPARYLTDRAVQARHDTVFPWGTLTVNLVGSLVLGILVGIGTRVELPPSVEMGVGTGLCGALTTYSTFGYETVRLAGDGARLFALLNAAVSVVAAVAAATLGYVVGRGL